MARSGDIILVEDTKMAIDQFLLPLHGIYVIVVMERGRIWKIADQERRGKVRSGSSFRLRERGPSTWLSFIGLLVKKATDLLGRAKRT